MITRFDIENYKDKDGIRYAMLCKTKEEAEDFCDYLDYRGRTWINGSPYKNNEHWDGPGRYHEGSLLYYFNRGSVSPAEYADPRTIIFKWSDFMKENKNFTKSDLTNFDRVTLRNEKVFIVNLDWKCIFNSSGIIKLKDYTDDLKYDFRSSYVDPDDQFDIVAVHRPTQAIDCVVDDYIRGECMYKRKEVEEMTLAEVCKALGKEIKIVKEK